MKKIALVAVSCFSALLFAACTPPPSVEDQPLKPVQQNQQSNASQTDQYGTPGQVAGTTDQMNTQQPPAQTQTNQADETPSSPPIPTTQKGSPMKQLSDFEKIEATEATIVTNKGEITFTLYRDKAPITTANFLSLVKSGYYEGIKFHRIIPDFMAQVGDPLTKDDSKKDQWGTGGPGYVIPDEFAPDLKHDSEGTVSMANAGPNTGGSQIFITYGATPWLDGKHAVFGKVTKGMDVLRQLQVGDTISKVTYK
jgi:cyclophilin family peptidyl-prolyl cis-trans isomerase